MRTASIDQAPHGRFRVISDLWGLPKRAAETGERRRRGFGPSGLISTRTGGRKSGGSEAAV